MKYQLLGALLCCLSLSLCRAQEAPDAPSLPVTDETYRIRVQNVQYGRVEASVDGGAHYLLIGRVLRPATAPGLDKTAKARGLVVRSGTDGIAFSIAPNEVLRLRPRSPSIKAVKGAKGVASKTFWPASETSAIVTNLNAAQDIFSNALLAPPKSAVRLQSEPRDLETFPEGYAPSEQDTFVLLVKLPLPKPAPGAPSASDAERTETRKADVRQRIEAQGKQYADTAIARANAERRSVVTGMLTLRARLPKGEPDPITAVTYYVDGDMVAAQNVSPFTYAWDTTRVENGEHVVEIRALNSRASVITRARALVVVRNMTSGQGP